MLKRIRTADIEPGMFLHKLEGPWFAHPFWKSKFLLEDADQIADLKKTGVEWVQIDLTRSRAPERAAPAGRTAPVSSNSGGRRLDVLRRARENEQMAGHAPVPRPAAPVAAPCPIRNGPNAALVAESAGSANLARRSQAIIRDLVHQVRQGKAIRRSALDMVVTDIMGSVERHPHAFTGILRLMKTSDYLYRHALSVSALMMNLAVTLRLDAQQVREAGLAGLLMDVGMGHVPPELFHREGGMNPDEQAIVRSHTTLARDFMGIGGDVPECVLDVCLHHHERLDGSGYPDGLAGDQIGLLVRMASICDAYDAMTSRRPHSIGTNPAIVLDMLLRDTDRLDADLLAAFARTVGIYPAGSLVRLSNDQLALVIDANTAVPEAPRVRSFFAIGDSRMILPHDIDLAATGDHIVAAERPEDWQFSEWEKLSSQLYGRAIGLNA